MMPKTFNPFEIFYDSGSEGLRSELMNLSFEEIKEVLVKFTAIKSRNAANKYDRGKLIDVIVRDVKARCHRGDSFGDYTIPD